MKYGIRKYWMLEYDIFKCEIWNIYPKIWFFNEIFLTEAVPAIRIARYNWHDPPGCHAPGSRVFEFDPGQCPTLLRCRQTRRRNSLATASGLVFDTPQCPHRESRAKRCAAHWHELVVTEWLLSANRQIPGEEEALLIPRGWPRFSVLEEFGGRKRDPSGPSKSRGKRSILLVFPRRMRWDHRYTMKSDGKAVVEQDYRRKTTVRSKWRPWTRIPSFRTEFWPYGRSRSARCHCRSGRLHWSRETADDGLVSAM